MNLKSLLPITLQCLCAGSLVLVGTLQASDEAKAEAKHITVGERMLPQSEEQQVELVQKRAAFTAEDDLEVPAQPTEEMLEASAKAKEQTEKDSVGALKLNSKAIYYTTHPGAFHYPKGVSIFGETVELEDGSLWSIYSGDRYLTLNWLVTDDIVITPNWTWYSIFQYRLVNQQTGASVQASLTLGPIYAGFYTHWIVAIDYYNNQICLEDGSVWSMSAFDTSITNKWLINDTIIIGVNDGVLSSTRPNILINVNTNNYGCGTCLFY